MEGALLIAGQLPGKAVGVAVYRLLFAPVQGIQRETGHLVFGIAAAQVRYRQGETIVWEQSVIPDRTQIVHDAHVTIIRVSK